MWRLPGLVCRALNRFHAPNVPSYVHGEAEALSPSSLIPLGQNVGGRSYTCNSSSHQTGQNGQDGQKKKETYRSFNCQLPHYSVLDAFGWGAAAVFFLQLARHASFQSSVTNSPREDRCTQRSYLEQILHSLAQTQNNSIRSQILPKRAPAGGWNDVRLQEKSVTDESGSSTESTSLASSSESGLVHPNTDEDASQLANSVNFITVKTKTPVPDSVVKAAAKRHSKEVLVPEDNLGESLPLAASKLLDVVENSVPVVLNISGIISARDRADYNTAFQFFQQSADSGYSKAQFNTGVCYEQGRGVEKDINKAAAYYLLAGKNGHMQAKYRFARCILQMQSKAKLEDIQTAVQMLKEAADAGLKEAQAYLGVLYTKEPYLDPQTAVRYIWMAAENGVRFNKGTSVEKARIKNVAI
ncbi:hypothetical protein XENTR_v10007930 [Xenopus tropicalis]|nr:hypothetical protein XENTR_v10007930 [Xenopus tropicalis]